MTRDTINDRMFDGLPDLVVLVRRDGVLLAHLGGAGVEPLRPRADSSGLKIEAQWPDPVVQVIRRLVRQAIATRGVLDESFEHDAHSYELRVCAQGPDRALCVLRQPSTLRSEDTEGTGRFDMKTPRVERRSFMRRFKESMSVAALRERPTSVAVVNVDGIFELAHVLDRQAGEQAMLVALRRLGVQSVGNAVAEPPWYAGQLNDGVLVIVIDSSDRDRVEQLVARLCDSLREPVEVNAAKFHLSPFAGVAMLGPDAAAPKLLLHHAWAAAADARRAGSRRVCFFSDTVQLRSLSRIDIAHELRDAVANSEIKLRYRARCVLATGAQVAAVGYLRWQHPLRGEVAASEFLGFAETTGIAASLSRAVLGAMRADYAALTGGGGGDMRVSFGPLRHHILHDGFFDDVKRLLLDGVLPADRLELRIGERSLAACETDVLLAVARLGVRLIVDEVGRGSVSFDLLARAPFAALQLDSRWVKRLPDDPIAIKVCRASIGVARAIGMTTIAHGVDHAAQHDVLLSLGCEQGIGEFYGDVAVAPLQAMASR